MDITTITIVIGLITLIIERGASWFMKIKKSKCCGNIIEMED